jgi:hypothetical protein
MRCFYCGAPRPPVGHRCAACGGPFHEGAPTAVTAVALHVSPPIEVALVLHAGTPLRDRARGPAAVLQTLDTGDRVHVLGRSGKHTHVRALNGVSGYVDAGQLGPPGDPPHDGAATPAEPAFVAVAEDQSEDAADRADLPFGVDALPGETVAYIGRFLYDPFNDRAFVVTSHRVIIGGGGAPLPRVVELLDIQSAQMREGSNGLAVGERTIVLQLAYLSTETYIAGLRDPERAFASLSASMREADGGAADPAH